MDLLSSCKYFPVLTDYILIYSAGQIIISFLNLISHSEYKITNVFINRAFELKDCICKKEILF